MSNNTFHRSQSAQLAAQCVISAARECGVIDGPISIAPEFAEAEKQLIMQLLVALKEHLDARNSTISADETASLFNFVFAKSAEAVTNFANHREQKFELLGLWDGKAPIAAEELLIGAFKQSDFARCAAQNFWDYLGGENAPAPAEAMLSCAEALKWCFRLGCHFAVATLEKNHYRFI